MYYFPVNLFLVSFQGCEYCIIRCGLEWQSAAVSFLAAHFGLPRSCFGNPEDAACCAWAGTPLTGVRGSFANGSRREFLPEHRNTFPQPGLLAPALHFSCFWAKEEAGQERCLCSCAERDDLRLATCISVLCLQWPIYTRTHLHSLQLVSCNIFSGRTVQGRKPGQPHTAVKPWALGLVLRANAPFLTTTAFQKFIWSGLNFELADPQWLHWAMEICLKLHVSKPFLNGGQSPKPILQDQLPDNQCSWSHGNHLLPLDQAKGNMAKLRPIQLSPFSFTGFAVSATSPNERFHQLFRSHLQSGCWLQWCLGMLSFSPAARSCR